MHLIIENEDKIVQFVQKSSIPIGFSFFTWIYDAFHVTLEEVLNEV